MEKSTLNPEAAPAAKTRLPELEIKPLFPAERKSGLPPDRWGVPLPVAIGIGALAYPLVAIPLGTLILVLQGFGPIDWATIMVASVVIPIVVALGTGWMTMFLSWGAWYVAYAVARSLRLSIDDSRLSAHVGAATSLVMCYLVWNMFYAEFRTGYGLGTLQMSEIVIAFLLGPGIATPLAQYAGAWSQWPANPLEPAAPTRRFGIYQIMVATAWVAAALSVLKLLGLLEPGPLLFLGVWLVYQWLTLKLVFRYGAWKVRRKGLQGGRWGWRGMRG